MTVLYYNPEFFQGYINQSSWSPSPPSGNRPTLPEYPTLPENPTTQQQTVYNTALAAYNEKLAEQEAWDTWEEKWKIYNYTAAQTISHGYEYTRPSKLYWEKVQKDFEKDLKNWRNGIHPILRGDNNLPSNIVDLERFWSYEGFLIIKYQG